VAATTTGEVADPRQRLSDLLKASAVSEIEISRLPPGYIFLCGGQVNGKPGQPPSSAREFFLRWVSDNDVSIAERIQLAEEINDWMMEGVYKEIFTLESNIAALASVIVIFVESPGAIAELGAFALLDGVADKLVVFLSEEHNKPNSFICLGPVGHLKEKHGVQPYIYPWEIPKHGDLTEEQQKQLAGCIHEMRDDLKSELAKKRSDRSFDPGRPRDQMLVICDLVNRLLCLTLTEIVDLLRSAGINLQQGEVRKLVFVLTKLGYLVAKQRGNEHFLLCPNDGGYIRFGFDKTSGVSGREKLQFASAAHYKAHHPARSSVIAEVNKDSASRRGAKP
jgi:hypothetical protein